MRVRKIGVFAAALGFGVISHIANAAGSITTEDLRACMGFAGAPPADQVAICTKVINSGKIKFPHQAEYYAYRAGAYSALQQNDKAKTDLDRALKLQDKPEFRFQRAGVLLAQGSLDEADADLVFVIKAKPEFAPGHFLVGVVHFRRAAFESAVTHFDKAAELMPTYFQAIYARGVARIRARDVERGREDVETARGMSAQADATMKKIGIEP